MNHGVRILVLVVCDHIDHILKIHYVCKDILIFCIPAHGADHLGFSYDEKT